MNPKNEHSQSSGQAKPAQRSVQRSSKTVSCFAFQGFIILNFNFASSPKKHLLRPELGAVCPESRNP